MMKIKMIVPKAGAANENGTQTRLYVLDEVLEAKQPWEQAVAQAFLDNGHAIEIKTVEPEDTVSVEAEVKEEKPKPKPKKKAAPKAKAKAKSE
tara:strand:- start:1290 stop:1568 length:279 start_codon:yes stop_codon:yes gene_type:complete